MTRTEGNGHCAALPANDHRDREVAKIATRGNAASPAFAPETPSRSQAVRTGNSSPRTSGAETQGMRSHALSEGPARDLSASDSFGVGVEVAGRDQRSRIGGAEMEAEGGAEGGAERGAERRAEGESEGHTEGEAEVRAAKGEAEIGAAEGGGSTSSRGRQVLIRVKRKRGEASSDVIVVEAAPRAGRTKLARSHLEALRALSLGGGGGGGGGGGRGRNERDAREARKGKGSAVEEAKALEGRGEGEDASASTAPPPPARGDGSAGRRLVFRRVGSMPWASLRHAGAADRTFRRLRLQQQQQQQGDESAFRHSSPSEQQQQGDESAFRHSSPSEQQQQQRRWLGQPDGASAFEAAPFEQQRRSEKESSSPRLRVAASRAREGREREAREGQLAYNYLPLLREFLPEAAREMEEKMVLEQRGTAAAAAATTGQLGPQENTLSQQQAEQQEQQEQQDTDSDDVCDLYCMEGCLSDDDDDMDGPLCSYLHHHSAPYPTLRICDNHVFDESGEPFSLSEGDVLLSEADSDDSDAENNPLNDYGDEEEDDDDDDEGMWGAVDRDGDDYNEYEEYESYAGRDDDDDDDDDDF
ncbi:unnamed protein product [Closterium sp. NIES-54]